MRSKQWNTRSDEYLEKVFYNCKCYFFAKMISMTLPLMSGFYGARTPLCGLLFSVQFFWVLRVFYPLFSLLLV